MTKGIEVFIWRNSISGVFWLLNIADKLNEIDIITFIPFSSVNIKNGDNIFHYSFKSCIFVAIYELL